MCIMLFSLQGNVQNMSLGICSKQSKHSKKVQHFQYVTQKGHCNKNLESFLENFAQNFNQKPTPKQCCEIMTF